MSATGRQAASKAESELENRLEPLVTALGFDLEEVRVARVGRRTLIKVVVDADGGLELDDIAEVSRAVDADLDADDPFSGPFVLEVSSPGVDRPLTEPRHWRRNVARLVEVDRDGEAMTGRIVSVDDGGVRFDVIGLPGGTARDVQTERRYVEHDRLGPGRVQVEFNRAATVTADSPGSAGATWSP